MKKVKVEVLLNKSYVCINKLLAREVHVNDSKIGHMRCTCSTPQLKFMMLYVPKFLDVDRISIAVVLKRK